MRDLLLANDLVDAAFLDTLSLKGTYILPLWIAFCILSSIEEGAVFLRY